MPTFDRTIDLPRGPMRVRVRGDGPAIIWSHGMFFPIDVDDQSTLGGVLCELEGFTVVRYDARGHGLTPAAPTIEAHRWDRRGQDVIEIADALHIESFIAAGISMGAAVTLNAALRAPERVRAMLLLGLPTAWEARPAEQQRYRDLAALGSSDAVAAEVQRELDMAFAEGTLPESLHAMVAHLHAADWPGLKRVILGAADSDLPEKSDLARLEIPTLVRAWPGDVGHPLATADALLQVLAHAEYEQIEGFDDAAGMIRAFDTLRG